MGRFYDETIGVLKSAIEKSKIGSGDKQKAIQQLSAMALKIEENFQPKPFFDEAVQNERDQSHRYGGMTVFGKATPPKKVKPQQLNLF